VTDRIAAAFAGHGKRAALMPYLMGGYPDLDASLDAGRAADAGASGLIVPDLPHDEAAELRSVSEGAGLALVPLVAPTTTPERVREIGEAAHGFVYAVSLTGTTGERDELPADLVGTVERVRAAAALPVAVGFGISTREQARSVAELADGVIVGSRVVRAVGEGGPRAVGEVVSDFAVGLASDW
jgi:tryptophan synthase alpha chain